MKFHWPSFLIGYAAGAGSVLVSKRLRPLILELATAGYRLVDTLVARASMRREDVEDILAEARARARGAHTPGSGRPSA